MKLHTVNVPCHCATTRRAEPGDAGLIARSAHEAPLDRDRERLHPRVASGSQHGVAQVLAQHEQLVGEVVRVVLAAEQHEQLDHAAAPEPAAAASAAAVSASSWSQARGQGGPQQRRPWCRTAARSSIPPSPTRGQRGEGQGVGAGGPHDDERGVEERLVGDRALAWHAGREYKRIVVYK